MATSTLSHSTEKTTLKPPARYRVVLTNDDFTPMDFVVRILKLFFDKPFDEATSIMLEVHHKGKGVCGVYSKDIAETKVSQVNQFAQDHQHPLLCKMEPAPL